MIPILTLFSTHTICMLNIGFTGLVSSQIRTSPHTPSYPWTQLTLYPFSLIVQSLMLAYAHTHVFKTIYTYTLIQSQTHSDRLEDTHSHTHSYSDTYTCAHKLILWHTLARIHSYSDTHPHSLTHTHTLTHPLAHTHTHAQTLTQTHTHTLTHLLAQTHTHTPTHTDSYTLTHTHTLAQTRTDSHIPKTRLFKHFFSFISVSIRPCLIGHSQKLETIMNDKMFGKKK